MTPEALKENLHLLKANGVQRLSIQYQGYGDEGNEEVTIYTAQGEVDDFPENLPSNMDDFPYQLVQHLDPGFENEDGGGGEITVDLLQGTISHTSYFNETVQTDNAPKILQFDLGGHMTTLREKLGR
jgi:hypothetical protein